MLTGGTKRQFLSLICPRVPARSFESHEVFMEHILARLQAINDFVRRNKHQAQQRQKLKYDRAIEEILYDCSQPSSREEDPLSGASNVSLPSRKLQWMDTMLLARIPAVAVVSTTSNSTISIPTQSVRALKTC